MSEIKAGSTDQSMYFVLLDVTTGEPVTGLTITALDATYTRTRALAVKNDLTALSAANDAHADNQAIQVDSANAPGLYRVDFPDAAFASGAANVVLSINGAAIKPAHKEFAIVVNTAEDVIADTNDIQTRLPAALVSGRMDSSVGAMEANTLTASALATDAVTEIQSGLATEANVDLVRGVTEKLDTTLAITAGSPGEYEFTADSLRNAPTGSGGGGTCPSASEIADEVQTRTIAAVTLVNGLAANVITAAATAGDFGTEIADALWDEVVDGATTARESMRLQNSAAGGKASGLATATAVFRDLADTKDRITATVDADGNRTAVTRDLT